MNLKKSLLNISFFTLAISTLNAMEHEYANKYPFGDDSPNRWDVPEDESIRIITYKFRPAAIRQTDVKELQKLANEYLREALKLGKYRTANILRNLGADPNAIVFLGRTLLNDTIKWNNPKAFRWLLEDGADPFKVGKDGKNTIDELKTGRQEIREKFEKILKKYWDLEEQKPLKLIPSFSIKE